jgi:hypothetical protein
MPLLLCLLHGLMAVLAWALVMQTFVIGAFVPHTLITLSVRAWVVLESTIDPSMAFYRLTPNLLVAPSVTVGTLDKQAV